MEGGRKAGKIGTQKSMAGTQILSRQRSGRRARMVEHASMGEGREGEEGGGRGRGRNDLDTPPYQGSAM
jgi:hypothetical protein